MVDFEPYGRVFISLQALIIPRRGYFSVHSMKFNSFSFDGTCVSLGNHASLPLRNVTHILACVCAIFISGSHTQIDALPHVVFTSVAYDVTGP